MANVIERVVIDGFWGDKTIEMKFRNARNFLIGVNGSGKTTFIDLLSAALTVDFDTLTRLEFTQIQITLKTIGKNQKPIIKIAKEYINEYIAKITYYVRESTSARSVKYEFDDFADIRMARRRRHLPRNELQHQGLQQQLQELVNVSWLPIWRSSSSSGRDIEDRVSPSIDAKLSQITKDFATYFSALQTQAQIETDLFQEKIFLSLITSQDRRRLTIGAPDEDLADEQSELEAVFNEFNMDKQKSRRNISSHFERVKSANKNVKGGKADIEDLTTLFDNQRVHRLLIDWRRLQRRRSEIYSLRNSFINILNELFSRKEVIITERNEVRIHTQSGKIFNQFVLSSGEKQLFIMLGEVLLFEKKPFVLIADEPELSLHVSWQSELVKSLQRLNQNMQIIFATHSPDIVGENERDIIKMEEKIRAEGGQP